MHPALRKGPLFFTKKHPMFSIFSKEHPLFHIFTRSKEVPVPKTRFSCSSEQINLVFGTGASFDQSLTVF